MSANKFKITYKKPIEELVPAIVLKLSSFKTDDFKAKAGDIQILEINKALGGILKNVSVELADCEKTIKFYKSQDFLSKNFKIVWNNADIGKSVSPSKELIIPYFSQKGNSHGNIAGFSSEHSFCEDIPNPEDSGFKPEDIISFLEKKKAVVDCFGFSYQAFTAVLAKYFEKTPIEINTEINSLRNSILFALQKCVYEDTNDLSTEWSRAKMYVKFKGGNAEDPSKYRPLICLPGMVRMFDFMIMENIHSFVLKNNCIDYTVQKGQLKGNNGCWEHRIDVNQRLLKLSQEKSPKIALFLDIQNAFGSVNYELMWTILEKIKISPKIITYLRKYYKQLKVEFKGEEFSWKNGLLQGSATSNILFLIYMDQAIKHFHQMCKNMGLSTVDVMKQNSFAFVDDCTFILERDDKLNDILRVLTRAFGDFGLSIAPKKTYYVEFMGEDIDLKIGSQSIERCPPNFKYLGHPLITSPTFISEIKEKVVDRMNQISALPIVSRDKLFIYENVIVSRLKIYLEMCYILGIDTTDIEFEEKYFISFNYCHAYQNYLTDRKKKILQLAHAKLFKATTPELKAMCPTNFSPDEDKCVMPEISYTYTIESIKSSVEKVKAIPSLQEKVVNTTNLGFYPSCFVEHVI